MFHSILMFLAPETAAEQATMTSPPAVARPAREAGSRAPEFDGAHPGSRWRLVAAVVGNAIGFAMLLGGCWFALLLMQLFL